MIVIVFATFLGAGAAHALADAQEFGSYFRVSDNKPRCKHTDIGAITVKFNASGKHHCIFFIQACGRALLASECTLDQVLDKLLARLLDVR